MTNIDTSKVKTIASKMIDINNRCKDDFSAVEQAINRLKNDWQQPQKVASSAFACFDEIKSKFFEPTNTERRELAQYLCEAVGVGYEEVENTNKNLLEQLFEVGLVNDTKITSTVSNTNKEDIKNLDYNLNKKIADVSNNKYYNSYNNGNSSGRKHQCVSYVYGRLNEKLGIDYNGHTNYAKDAIDSNMEYHNKIITSNTGDKFRVEIFKETNGEHIKANSWVSFDKNQYSPEAGHIVYVEDVVVENGEKFVYFSHGGQALHSSQQDGVLNKQKLFDFINRPGGCVGVINFNKI